MEPCDICQRIKQPTQRPAGTAKMIQVPERPFQSICIDIIGPFPSSQGYEYALVVVDRFSSFIRIVPLKKKFNTLSLHDALPICTLLIHAAQHRLAHYGVTKTYRDLSKDTFWPGQWEQTKKFVESCDICQRIKQPTQRPAGIAKMIQVPERPFQSICIDIIGPFPPSQAYEYALVVVNRFSSFIRIVPLKEKFNM